MLITRNLLAFIRIIHSIIIQRMMDHYDYHIHALEAYQTDLVSFVCLDSFFISRIMGIRLRSARNFLIATVYIEDFFQIPFRL